MVFACFCFVGLFYVFFLTLSEKSMYTQRGTLIFLFKCFPVVSSLLYYSRAMCLCLCFFFKKRFVFFKVFVFMLFVFYCDFPKHYLGNSCKHRGELVFSYQSVCPFVSNLCCYFRSVYLLWFLSLLFLMCSFMFFV